MNIQVGIITVSDRAAAGQYEDFGGPLVAKAADGYGWAVIAETVVPDDKEQIQRAIREQIAKGAHLVLTTGGTGVAPRDVTPEAVKEIADRELPGFGEVMRMESMKITKNAILSRNLAAAVGNALVICLPGKPKGAEVSHRGMVHWIFWRWWQFPLVPQSHGERGSRSSGGGGGGGSRHLFDAIPFIVALPHKPRHRRCGRVASFVVGSSAKRSGQEAQEALGRGRGR